MSFDTYQFNNNILNNLNNQRKSGKFCDVIIKLHNEFSIHAHFCIVAQQSNFIGGEHFLQESWNFSIHNPLTIEILNFDCSDCLETMFEFFYSNDITISLDHKSHMKTLANMLGASDMSQILKSLLDDETNNHSSGAEKKEINQINGNNHILKPKQRRVKLSYA